MRTLPVLELTWYVLPSHVPTDPAALLQLVAKTLPAAYPRRYGRTDPPRIPWNPDGFRSDWKEMLDIGYFVHWTGRAPFLGGSVLFPDRRGPDEPGQPAAQMTWHLDAEDSSLTPQTIVDAFVEVSVFLRATYGCGYLLDGWSLSRGVLMMNVNSSESSQLPGRWLGIPPGNPWIAWFAPSYAVRISSRPAELVQEYPSGLLLRRSEHPVREGEAGQGLDIPAELLARRSDPRWALPPDLEAIVMPS